MDVANDIGTFGVRGRTRVKISQRTVDVLCVQRGDSVFILPALGTMPLGAVGREEVSALHFRLRDTPGAANRALKALSKMFSLAESWDLTPAGGNPCRHVVR